MENKRKKFLEFIKNRLFICFCIIFCSFGLLGLRLYQLQILQGEKNLHSVRASTIRTLEIQAQRGKIYDKFGRPLAVNEAIYDIKLDLSTVGKEVNQTLISVLMLLEENEEPYYDQLPISEQEPYYFTFSSKASEKRWKKDMGLKEQELDWDANQVMQYLQEKFDLQQQNPAIARKLISLHSAIYLQRFKKYQLITIAKNIGNKTIAVLEENHNQYQGIMLQPTSYRIYPIGENFSHILGYLGKVNELELEQLEKYGYHSDDFTGKLGIEKAYELELKGEKGQEIIEVDASGKRIQQLQLTPPKQGNDIFLSIDSRLQIAAYRSLEKNLTEVLVKKIKQGIITLPQMMQSMIDSNFVDIKQVMQQNNGSIQTNLKNKILSSPLYQEDSPLQEYKDIVKSLLETGTISSQEIIWCLLEQEKITCDEKTLYYLQEKKLPILTFIQEKLRLGEITPRDINCDPSTGSIAVVEVETGKVLALVTYPSYDNNYLVNNFDNAYYQSLLEDPLTPLVNRPVMERKAPGSIFKMLMVVAGMEEGIIDSNTTIEDLGIYKKVGQPYAKCLIYSRYNTTHGFVNAKRAIEVSCNYFFYELAYRMGNYKEGTTLQSIETIQKYMEKFGLHQASGIEIEETNPKMAAPQVKEQAIRSMDIHASNSQTAWMDGDSIRCAIGQSYNSFSAIHMAKYIATIANRGNRYQLSLIEAIKKEQLQQKSPQLEEQLNFSDQTFDTVFEAMRLVTKGTKGTLRTMFADFPLEVAAKTGTAEESSFRPSHTWFAGFAPYENPQIAVVVMIPFGEDTLGPSTKVAQDIFLEYLGYRQQADFSSMYKNVLSP